jgi:hypothetical protein
MIIYGTLAASDIRIKSLEETHKDHFLQLMVKYHEELQAVIPGASE